MLKSESQSDVPSAERTCLVQQPGAVRALKPVTAGIQAITMDERRTRIEKARSLSCETHLDHIGLSAPQADGHNGQR